MREIYSKAGHVLMWVGENFSSGPTRAALFEFIVGIETLITGIMSSVGPWDRYVIEMALVQNYITYFIRWNFLRELLSRAWFISLTLLNLYFDLNI